MSRPMKILLVTVCLVVAAVAAIALVFGSRALIGPRSRPLTNRTFEATPARLARGKYLSDTALTPCVLCHSPLDVSGGGLKVAEGKAFAGRPFAPDGVPFATAPNLTPDRETGIGTWSDDMLARAIREGISHDGRAIFPVMPYQRFRRMSDEDLAALVVYLRSLPPIRNPMAPTKIPFPLNRLINGVPEPVDGPVAADLSSAEKRGEYLVRIAICADCHSTRDDQGNARQRHGLRRRHADAVRGTADDRHGQYHPGRERHPVLHGGAVHRNPPHRQSAIARARPDDADCNVQADDRSGPEGYLRVSEDAEAGRSLRGQLVAAHQVPALRAHARRRRAKQEGRLARLFVGQAGVAAGFLERGEGVHHFLAGGLALPIFLRVAKLANR